MKILWGQDSIDESTSSSAPRLTEPVHRTGPKTSCVCHLVTSEMCSDSTKPVFNFIYLDRFILGRSLDTYIHLIRFEAVDFIYSLFTII